MATTRVARRLILATFVALATLAGVAEGGSAFSKILGALVLNRNVRILMLGLDGSGKTTGPHARPRRARASQRARRARDPSASTPAARRANAPRGHWTPPPPRPAQCSTG